MGRNKRAELSEGTMQMIKFMNSTSLVILIIALICYPASLIWVNVTSPDSIQGGWSMDTDPASDVFYFLTFAGIALSVAIKGIAAEIRYRAKHLNAANPDSPFFMVATARILLWIGAVLGSFLFSLIFTTVMNGLIRQ